MHLRGKAIAHVDPDKAKATRVGAYLYSKLQEFKKETTKLAKQYELLVGDSESLGIPWSAMKKCDELARKKLVLPSLEKKYQWVESLISEAMLRDRLNRPLSEQELRKRLLKLVGEAESSRSANWLWKAIAKLDKTPKRKPRKKSAVRRTGPRRLR